MWLLYYRNGNGPNKPLLDNDLAAPNIPLSVGDTTECELFDIIFFFFFLIFRCIQNNSLFLISKILFYLISTTAVMLFK